MGFVERVCHFDFAAARKPGSLCGRKRWTSPAPRHNRRRQLLRSSTIPDDPSRDGEGEFELSTSDDQFQQLLRRVSAFREKDAREDLKCAANWRQGICRHEILIKANKRIQHLQLSGSNLAFGTETGETCIIDLSTKAVMNAFDGHQGAVTALYFDGEWLLTGGADRTARVQLVSRKNVSKPKRSGKAISVSAGSCLRVLGGHGERVSGVARVSRNRVATSSLDGIIRFWDVIDPEDSEDTPEDMSEAAERMGFSSEGADPSRRGGSSSSGDAGKQLLSETPDKTFNANSPVLCMAASDGFVAAGLMSGHVVILNGESGRAILSFRAHRGAVRSLYFPGKEVLVTGGGDGAVAFWDLVQGGAPVGNKYEVDGRSLTHRFEGHQAPIVAVACDLTKLISASVDGVVRVWDMRRGSELFRIEGCSSAIRSVQFNRQLLITDGTHDRVISHDFSGDIKGQTEFRI